MSGLLSGLSDEKINTSIQREIGKAEQIGLFGGGLINRCAQFVELFLLAVDRAKSPDIIAACFQVVPDKFCASVVKLVADCD